MFSFQFRMLNMRRKFSDDSFLNKPIAYLPSVRFNEDQLKISYIVASLDQSRKHPMFHDWLKRKAICIKVSLQNSKPLCDIYGQCMVMIVQVLSVNSIPRSQLYGNVGIYIISWLQLTTSTEAREYHICFQAQSKHLLQSSIYHADQLPTMVT